MFVRLDFEIIIIQASHFTELSEVRAADTQDESKDHSNNQQHYVSDDTKLGGLL
ncbi:MAG: hypothetical protein ABF651_07585 [Sporolactobacillus sp.]